jgi:antitoxin (DNA-binding transcriptional repressor) of toxin-antitoxin stability system
MRTVDLEVLEKEFDEWLRIVIEGETILITENGQPLAEFGPPRPEHQSAS